MDRTRLRSVVLCAGGILICLAWAGCRDQEVPDPAQDLSAATSAVQSLEQELSRVKFRSSVLEEDIDVLNEKLAEAERLLSDSEAQLDQKTKEAALAHARLRAFLEDLRKTKQELRRVTASLERSKREKESARALLQDTRGRQSRAASSRQQTELDLRDTQARLDEALTVARAQEDQLEEFALRIQTLEEYISQIDASRTPRITPRDRVLKSLVPTTSRPLTRKRFGTIVRGMSVAEVTAYLGRPHAIRGTSPQYYDYRRPLTYAVDPAEPDAVISLTIYDGVVQNTFFEE